MEINNLSYEIDNLKIKLDKKLQNTNAIADYSIYPNSSVEVLKIIKNLFKLENLLNKIYLKQEILTSRDFEFYNKKYKYSYDIMEKNMECRFSVSLLASKDISNKYNLSILLQDNINSKKQFNLFNNRFIAYNMMVIGHDLRSKNRYSLNLKMLNAVYDNLDEENINTKIAKKLFYSALSDLEMKNLIKPNPNSQ